MRPPDENQPASMRASFMSAPRRPASTEDNILARMERDGRRGGARVSWKRSWVAWCSVAGLAIIGLVGLLASLARDNVALHQPAAAGMAAAPTPAPEPYRARASVVASEAPPSLPVSAAVPDQPTAPAAVVDVRPAPAANAPRKSAPLAAAKPPPVRTVAASVARTKKPAPAPEPAVDSDVALLSAIILHSSRHAGERAQLEAARCGAGRKCPPAPSPEPLTWLKTLD